MRMEFVVAGAVMTTIMAMSAGVTVAGSDPCCGEGLPKVVYALPPAPFVIPPTGYVLDPADARRPFYVVNSPFGVGFAAPTYARPTFSEGGYAFADDFPDVLRYGASSDPFDRPFGAPPYTAYRYRPAPNARIIHLDDN